MQSSNYITPKTPHFFKIILADTLSQGKIGIPKRYVRKHGNDLLISSTVLLSLPDGRQWEMGLTKSEGTIWLQNGWQEFAQHYLLKQGSFLVFGYDGSCRFDVVILDLSATEIEYPNRSNAGECSKSSRGLKEQAAAAGTDDDDDDDDNDDDDDDNNDDVSLEIVGEALDTKKTKGTSQVPSSNAANWMKDVAGHRRRGMEVGKRWTNYIRKEKAKDLGRAKGFKSNNPFFIVVMYPSYVGPSKSRLVIPAYFAKRNAPGTREQDACLRLAGVGSWQVKYHYCLVCKNGPYASFRQGWRKFVRDNDLKVRDVCAFELGIPKRYVRKYGDDLLSSNTVFLRLPDGKQWPIGLTKSDGRIWLQNGWQEFAQHYRLKQGTFLVFRYDGSCRFYVVILDLTASEIDYPRPSNAEEGSRTNRELQGQAGDVVDEDDADDVSVEIIGVALCPKQANDHRRPRMEGGKRLVRYYTREEKAKALGRAEDFKSNKPFFKVLMSPSYVRRKHSGMPIPTDFVREHISEKGVQYAHLHLASGRSWRVKCHCLSSKKPANAWFFNGWWEFVRDNHLQVGDVCIFELVNPSDQTFEVTIYSVQDV